MIKFLHRKISRNIEKQKLPRTPGNELNKIVGYKINHTKIHCIST
jgi:hypothetical protein